MHLKGDWAEFHFCLFLTKIIQASQAARHKCVANMISPSAMTPTGRREPRREPEFVNMLWLRPIAYGCSRVLPALN